MFWRSTRTLRTLFVMAARGRIAPGLICLAAAAGTSAAELIKPRDLQTPSELTCIDLKEPLLLLGHPKVGPFKRQLVLYTRLQRGPYLSEKTDGRGTFYRAPPGGIRIHGDEPPKPDQKGIDGGLYVPNDPNESVKIYSYIAAGGTDSVVPPSEADCSNAGYVKDPATSKLSLVAWSMGGALGGAAGGVAGRSMVPSGKLSYAHAAGAGAAGGLIAGAFIAAMINRDMGKIIVSTTYIPDPEYLVTLKTLAASKVPLRELPIPEAVPDAQPTMAPATAH